jgi:hypothetical protein
MHRLRVSLGEGALSPITGDHMLPEPDPDVMLLRRTRDLHQQSRTSWSTDRAIKAYTQTVTQPNTSKPMLTALNSLQPNSMLSLPRRLDTPYGSDNCK